MGVVVGVDVWKGRLDGATHPGGDVGAEANGTDGIAALLKRLETMPEGIGRVVVEATGGDERAVVTALGEAGIPTAVKNPRRVRQFARASGREAKTDRIDAVTLAHFGAVLAPAPRPHPSPATARVAAVVVRRRQLIAMRTQERQHRLTAPPDVQADIDAHLDELDARVRQLTGDREAAVAAEADLAVRAACS